MQLGLIGLGKMGFNMRARLREGGHDVVGYDPRPEVSDVASLADLAAALPAPRVVWVMVPSGTITDQTITELAQVLGDGDLVIDGGNSRYTEDAPHAKLLAEKGIAFIDAGVSGGIWGLNEGYGLMVGGDDADVARAMPIFDALRPPGPVEDGFVHVGPVGAGHFAKMVHNGVEYALMTAYAEGYEMLAAEDLVRDPQAVYQAWSTGPWCGPGCSNCWPRHSRKTRASTTSAATPRIPAKGDGPSKRRSGCGCRCRASRRRCSRGSCRARRTPHHEGGGRPAQPVRWPCRQTSERIRVTGADPCTYVAWR